MAAKKTQNAALKRENRDLAQQVRNLARDLLESRKRVETAMDSARLQVNQEWEEREKKYKAVIRGLKDKLRQESSTVPIKVYKTEVERVQQLTNTVAKLEKELNQVQSNNNQVGIPSHKTPRKKYGGEPRFETPKMALDNQSLHASSAPFATLRSQRLSRQIRSPEAKKLLASPPVPPPPPPQAAKLALSKKTGNENVPVKRVTVVAPPSRSAPEVSKQPMLKKVSFSPVAKKAGRSEVRMNIIRNGGKRLDLQEKFQLVRSPNKPLQETNR